MCILVVHVWKLITNSLSAIMLYPTKVSDPDWEAPSATARMPASNESTSGYSSSLIGNSTLSRQGGVRGLEVPGAEIRVNSRATDNSASIVRMLPNMTLVMNLNKDELTSSLGRPTPSPRLESPFRPSNISDSLTESLERRSLHSDGGSDDSSSTLTDTDSSTKLQNVVRLKLGGGNEETQIKSTNRRTTTRNRTRSRSRSRSKTPPRQAVSPASSRPGRVQAIGAPVAIFNDKAGEYSVSFPVRRAASLESMQDNYPSDAETTSSSMGIVPRFLKSKSSNYGMRFLKKSDREKVYSQSNPDLTQKETTTILQPTGAMTTGRLPSRKNVSFSNADIMTGVKEVYMRDNLQVTVSDKDLRSQSPLVTYTRKPGMERAAKVAFRSVNSNVLPRANSPARPVSPSYRPSSPPRSISPAFNSLPRAMPHTTRVQPRVMYQAATLPNRPPPQYHSIMQSRVNGYPNVSSLPREYRTAPLNASPAQTRRIMSSDSNWELKPKEQQLSSTSTSLNSETDSDIVYQGTLTLKRQQNGSFHAHRSMYQVNFTNPTRGVSASPISLD